MTTGRYDDIINLAHHESASRRRMPAEARAAQFASFAALSGHDEMIHERGRVTDGRVELSSDEQELLSVALRRALESEPRPEVEIDYFIPDVRKAGGRYVVERGSIGKLDEYDRTIIMNSGMTIRLDDIVDIRFI